MIKYVWLSMMNLREHTCCNYKEIYDVVILIVIPNFIFKRYAALDDEHFTICIFEHQQYFVKFIKNC